MDILQAVTLLLAAATVVTSPLGFSRAVTQCVVFEMTFHTLLQHAKFFFLLHHLMMHSLR